MSKLNNTPGPWVQEYDGSIVMGGQMVVMPHYLAPDTAKPSEQQANASLMCAALEMYEALKAWERCDTDARHLRNAALAKAEGRSR